MEWIPIETQFNIGMEETIMKENKENKCYVLTCHCYSGEDSVSVFWNESDAYKRMNKFVRTHYHPWSLLNKKYLKKVASWNYQEVGLGYGSAFAVILG